MESDHGMLLAEPASVLPAPAMPPPPPPLEVESAPTRARLFRAPTANLWTAIILVSGSAALPWIASPSVRAIPSDIPVRFLYDVDAPSGGVSLFWIVTGLAAAILLGSISPATDWLRRIAGTVALIVPFLVMTQWLRYLDESGQSNSFWGFIGVGCFSIGAGGLLAMLSSNRK